MATNPFLKDFDTLLTDILVDYKNLDSAPDVTEGSPVFVKGTVSASALYGLYRYQDYLSKQIFPDSADTANLNHWGSIYGIARLTDESDADYAQRILLFLQTPPAGGTAQDYYNWALTSVPSGIPANRAEVFAPSAVNTGTNIITLDGVTNLYGWVDADPVRFTTTGTLPSGLNTAATFYAIYVSPTTIKVSATSGGTPLGLGTQGTGQHTIAHGVQAGDPNSFYIKDAKVVTPNDPLSPTSPGTVSVALVPSDEAIVVPGSQYYAAAWTLEELARIYIDARRPVTANANTVAMETIDRTTVGNFTMTVNPSNAPVAQIKADVENYINSLDPGQTLYQSQLEAIALRDGAVNAAVTSSGFISGQVVPTTSTQTIRFLSVTITAV